MAKSDNDTIHLTLSAEETVVNETVRITATLTGMISPNDDEDAFRDSIRTLLQRFIKADWGYANQMRSAHGSGDEQITLMATTRVSEAENQALDRRRQEASREQGGRISINSVSVDSTPSADQIEQVQSTLRSTLLKKAQTELKVINDVMNEKYRISDVSFQSVEPFSVSNRGQMHTMAAPSGGSAPLGNAVKLAMTAAITFSILVKLRR